MFANFPQYATFAHAGVRAGYEAVCFRDPAGMSAAQRADTYLLEGGTAAIEADVPWSVQYRVAVDERWHTTRVRATGISLSGHHLLNAEVRDGRWWINGIERPDLDGCIDVDFETSLVTNTLAAHRIDLSSTTPIEVPAAFVRFGDLRVERLEQTYLCTERTDSHIVFDYSSKTFDFSCQLVFDRSGLVTDYPGVGRRHQ